MFHIPGMRDDDFIRGAVPMTKEEIRAITLCKAQIRADHVVYDVGAGTGSISVEAALMAPQGKVYAVERKDEGIALIGANAARFKVHNLEIVQGEAPAALRELPDPDIVIIGGSGGKLIHILDLCEARLKPGGKIVINAVTLDTLCLSQRYFAGQSRYAVDMTCVAVTKVRLSGGSHLFQAQNPVYIIAAARKE